MEETNRLADISKVDFVKVRIWLSKEHYFVLSRYMISRFLTVTKIPHKQAIEMTLDLKKGLVDEGVFDVTQKEVEERLFNIVRKHGYSENYVSRYQMMSNFHRQRTPLIILIAGTACIGKATLANSLASRFNLPTVLQTEVVYRLQCCIRGNLSPEPAYLSKFDTQDELLSEYMKRCRIVRESLEQDIKKTLKEGKSLLIEGLHLFPDLFVDLVHSLAPQNCHGENGVKGVLIPILVTLNPSDHIYFSHNRFAPLMATTQSDRDRPSPEQIFSNLLTIDRFLKEAVHKHKSEHIRKIVMSKTAFCENLVSSSKDNPESQVNNSAVDKQASPLESGMPADSQDLSRMRTTRAPHTPQQPLPEEETEKTQSPLLTDLSLSSDKMPLETKALDQITEDAHRTYQTYGFMQFELDARSTSSYTDRIHTAILERIETALGVNSTEKQQHTQLNHGIKNLKEVEAAQAVAAARAGKLEYQKSSNA